jgi:AbrB family looped-hinge helix DNA binding protein
LTIRQFVVSISGVKATVTVNAQGRMTIPAEIRRELGIEGEAILIVETDAGRLIARPAVVIPAEDAWLYTPEHVARVKQAEAAFDAGQSFQLTEDELRARIGLPPAAEDVDDE